MDRKNDWTYLFCRFFFVFIFSIASLGVYSQTPKDAMEKIKNSSAEKYKWGEGDSKNEEEAKSIAMENLLMSLRTTLSLTRQEKERETDKEYSFEQTSDLRAHSIATVENLSLISFEDDNGWHALYYVDTKYLKEAEQLRLDHVKDMILLGMEQEGKLNIAGALKYYTWALSMLNTFSDKLTMELEGRNQDARPWLQQHIPMVLDNISLILDGNEIDYDEFDYDHYVVNLTAMYVGKPISALDLSYFNGEREVKPVHAKNGKASLSFPDLSNFKELAIKVLYDYPEEGKLYDKELEAMYKTGYHLKFDTQASQKISISVKQNKLSIKSDVKKELINNTAYETAPIIKEDRKLIERPTTNSEVHVEIMKKVEASLINRDYDAIKELFTSEGWSIFYLMMRSGEVRVNKKSNDYIVESTPLFTIGKGIPVSIKNGRHVSNETIVFRFDKESSLISSVAYALTKKAEDDIFRQAQWNIDSRYSLLTFMEDYQTAFAIKRLDYIKSIFSDDAIIITGKFADEKNNKRFYDASMLMPGSKNIQYTKYSKDEYIKRLETDFFDKKAVSYKKYIQLVFEDAVISKVATGGFVDNDVMWIEIKQQYISDKYSDKGYLALQINLKPSGSRIHVRTWTPQFMEIDDLKNRFNVGF